MALVVQASGVMTEDNRLSPEERVPHRHTCCALTREKPPECPRELKSRKGLHARSRLALDRHSSSVRLCGVSKVNNEPYASRNRLPRSPEHSFALLARCGL
jgi:hypothetical protein